MQKIKFTIPTLLVVLLCFNVYAQERKLPEVDENYQKYLDDGRNTGADGDLKLAVSSLVNGFINLQYEQKLSPSFSVEAGGAVQVAQGVDLVNILFLDIWADDEVFKNGYGFSGALRYYAGESAITNLGYASLAFRNRTTNFEDSKITVNDIYYSTGLKSLFMKTFSADISTGMGARMYNYSHEDGFRDDSGIGVYLGFELKLGYYIKYN